MVNSSKKAVFLDRDGVLNRSIVVDGKSYAPRKLDEFRLLPNARFSVKSLQDFNYKVIVVTNQPDIGNGLIFYDDLTAMHKKLDKLVKPDDIVVCPHRQTDDCLCRKPKPGLLIQASIKYNIDLSKSFMVGDRAIDIEAGFRAGCRNIFIDRNYSEPKPTQFTYCTTSILKAVQYILNHS